jgi:hypothetical protein
MKVCHTMLVCTTLLTATLVLTGSPPARGQEQGKDHAVSSGQLRKDVQKAAEARRANEAAVRELFISDAAKETLQSAGIDYQKVDQAVGQASDEDLARLAERSQEARKDFAAGRLADRDLLIILLVAVALILIIVAVH